MDQEKSHLDPFFYFKRGYSQYITYAFGVFEFVQVIALSLVVMFHISVMASYIFILTSATPAAYITIRLGKWDMIKGGKKIDVRLHYKNDEVWMAQLRGTYALLKREDPKEAERFKEVMARYGLMEDEP